MKEKILNAAISLSTKIGYVNITSPLVAEKAKVSYSLIPYYFKSVKNLKAQVLKRAIELEILSIIIQGICNDDPLAKKIPMDLKIKSAQYLINK